MVVFGSEAFTQCPLTLDHGILTTFLKRLDIGMAGPATSIGTALATAVKRLKNSSAKSKVIILLTDGRQTVNSISPTEAAKIAKAIGVKIYTIGAATKGKVPYLIEHPIFGPQVQYNKADIDDTTLKQISNLTEGEYYRAEDTTSLSKIYEQIDKLERTEIKNKSYMEYEEKFYIFTFFALFLLLLEVILLGTRFQKIP